VTHGSTGAGPRALVGYRFARPPSPPAGAVAKGRSDVRARSIARALAVVWAALVVPILAAAPALARVDDGETPPLHESAWTIVLYFVAIPVGAFAIIALLTYAPSWRRGPRYRPSKVWDYQATWFNGPDEPEKAIATVGTMAMKGGGASASW
jgi:hypothetical protein